MKKRIAIFAVVLCLFSLLFALPTMAAADSKAPTLKTLTLKKTSIKAPGEIEVVGTATDDNSGVSSFSVSFYSEKLNEYISCSLSKTYWDDTTYKYVPYKDGKYHGFLKADQYQESGTFKIKYVSLRDEAGNSVSYYPNPTWTGDKKLNSTMAALKFTVKETNPDSAAPVLKTLTLKKTSMKAPGKIEVVGTATDDNSGVSSFSVSFYCEKLNEYISCSLSKTYWDDTTYKYVPYKDGKYHGFLKSDEYQEAGIFKIKYVSLRDEAGNSVSYYPNPTWAGDKKLNSTMAALKFTVKEAVADTTVPVLKTLTLKKTSMKAPGKIEVVGTATDDNSGVSSFSVSFYCEKLNEYISCSLSKTYWDDTTYKYVPYKDGKYHGFLKSDEYQEAGIFKIKYVSLRDEAGNSVSYYPNPTWAGDKKLNSTIAALKFKVTNVETPASITTQPKSAVVKSGEAAKVTVKAKGDGLSYTWYIKNKGASKYTKSSVTKSIYSTTMNSKSKDRLVYCVVKDKYGNKVKTKTVALRMAATVTTQPKSVKVTKGSTAKVSVKAAGDGLKYTWYIKNKGATKFSKSSVTKSSYAVTMSSKVKGRQVYCVVTDKYGKKAKTATVTLNMK